MISLRLRPGLIVIAAFYAHSLSACGAKHYFSTAYATVPVQFVSTPYGGFEVLDRPDVGRLAIAAIAEDKGHFAHLAGYVREILPLEPAGANASNSPGSAYFEPLMQYFAQTGRSCRPVRGVPLAYGQWEFVYSCSPSFDTTVITWKPAGYSNAPLPPRR